MRLVTFIWKDKEEIGIVTDDNTIIRMADLLPEGGKLTMVQLIAYFEFYEDEFFKVLMRKSASVEKSRRIPLEQVKLCAPIPKPIHDILCVGVNYRNHLDETKENFDSGKFKEPESTVYFSKRAIEIVGTGGCINSRLDLDEQLDYEVELAVIIGKRCSNVKKENAESVIFGYSIFNDLSSRKLQQQHFQWYRGKSLDTYAAMGPWIVTKDEMLFPVNIRSYVNGQLRQDSNTEMFLKGIPELIEELTNGITLEPGDIVATGTPGGVGMAMKPPSFMKKGDMVACEIERIGMLTNKII